MNLKKWGTLITLLSLSSSVWAVDRGDAYNCLQALDARTTVMNDENTMLVLDSCALKDRDASAIAAYLKKHPQINQLSMGGFNGISHRGMAKILNASHFNYLYLDDAFKLDDDVAKVIAEHPEIEILQLKHNAFTAKGVAYIATMPNLTWLNLSGGYVIDDAAAKSLANLSKLEYLDLSNNQIGDEGAKALTQLPKLDWLDLSNNDIRDEGAIAFGNSALSSLYITGNHITDRAVQVLAGSSINMLYLEHNEIGDAGAIALASSPIIRYYVDVSYNHIGTSGLAALESAQNINYVAYDRNDGNLNAHSQRAASKEMISGKYREKLCKNKSQEFCDKLIQNR